MKWKILLVGFLLTGLAVGAVLRSREASVGADYKFPTYSSIEELLVDADTVIMGEVVGEGDLFFDAGGAPIVNDSDREEADRTLLVPIRVSDSLRGNVKAGQVIRVFEPAWKGNHAVPLATGQIVVLLVKEFSRADLEEKYGSGVVFARIGENASVFDVTGDTIYPRESSLPTMRIPELRAIVNRIQPTVTTAAYLSSQ